MSILLMTQVWEIVLSPTETLVMQCLADHGSDDGTRIFPSQGRIAWKTGLSERQVRRILKGLENQGLLEVVGYANGGRGHATEYTMHLERGTPKPPYEPPAKADTMSEFTEKADTMSGFTEKADISNINPDICDTKADICDTKADISNINPDILSINPDTVSAQPLVTIREPLREPLEITTRVREEITNEDFEFAAQLWRMICQHLHTQLSDAQRHWLADVQLMPNLESPGYVLIAPNGFTRGIIEQRWAKTVELKAMSISGRRLPVVVMTAGEYQRQLMAAEGDEETSGEAAEA